MSNVSNVVVGPEMVTEDGRKVYPTKISCSFEEFTVLAPYGYQSQFCQVTGGLLWWSTSADLMQHSICLVPLKQKEPVIEIDSMAKDAEGKIECEKYEADWEKKWESFLWSPTVCH